MIHVRQEDQVAAGQRDVRGHPRALSADRSLDDLDHELLAFLQELLDGFRRVTLGLRDLDGLVLQLQERLVRADPAGELGDVNERRLVLPDVDEGGLQAGQDLDDFALIDVADVVPVLDPIDVEVRQDLSVEDYHAGFLPRDIDDDL